MRLLLKAGFGLFAISAATIFWEVLLTRIFSIYLWGYFAFLILSLALLGFGASGSLLRIFPSWKNRSRLFLLLFLVSGIAIYFLLSRIPFDPVRIAWDYWQFLWLALFYLSAALPCLFSGLYVASCFARFPERSSSLYGINLFGSALGAILSLVALNHLPLEGIRMSPYKSLRQALEYPEARLLATHWSAQARLDLVKSGAVRFAPGLSLNFLSDLPEQTGLTLDGDRMNAITPFDGDFDGLSFLGDLPSAAAYAVLSQPRVLVIESSGGLNLLEALYHQSPEVDAIETNEHLVALVELYSHPKIKRITQHVRHYLAGSEKRYGLIVLSLSDSPSAASTGLYGLNENYLYTVEAFAAYLDHLQPEGYFTVTRYLLPPPREEPRSVALAVAALRSRKVEQPYAHLAMVESYGTWTLLMKKTPIQEAERRRLEEFCKERGFALIHPVPAPPGDSIFNPSPATDQRPFFFHFFKLSKLPETYRLLRDKWEAFFEAGYLVHFTLLQALLWGALLILAPVLMKRGQGKLGFRPGAYFFLIGLAFMFVELAFLQKAIFLFGNPTIGFAYLLALLLSFTGLGSLVLRRRFKIWFFCIAALILGSALVKDWLLSACLGIPLFFFLGAPFPLALSRLEAERIPMAWALNGVASVLGSILAVMIAMAWGYSVTLLAAGFLYLLAGLGFWASPVIGTKRTSASRSV